MVELDTVGLQRTWSAWFTLTPTVGGPLCAESTPLLLALLRDENQDELLPHCSLILQGDSRSWLARQARQDVFLGDSPAAVAANTGLEPWLFLNRQIAEWPHQSVPRRAVLVRILTQLGFYRLAAELTSGDGAGAAGAAGSHPSGDHLAYETARALRQHLRDSAVTDAFARLATEGELPVPRVLSCTQLISILLRDRGGERGSDYWMAYGQELLPALDEVEPWSRALTTSRFWRAAAFHRITDKDADAARAAMDAAYEAGAEAESLAADSQQWHSARENTRLLLDVTVKAGTMLHPADHVERAAEELLRVDGNEPSARYFAGAWFQRDGDVKRAAEEFERGAQAGGLRGAGAAYKAVLCRRELADADGAARATRLLFELDPAALLPGETTPEGA
ncbi:hypothetical protein ACLQ2R_31435 [Streptosporangium sp. DT93]|uniref:hypothetical protein n=1 Tax=Streptosporangium sp. DT93 TaxID=3393428 RepID=UPI003CF71220